jgi:hypothetical protein
MKPAKPNRKQSKKGNKKPAAVKAQAVPNIKELLLNGPKFDLIIPKRTKWKRRPPVIFD